MLRIATPFVLFLLLIGTHRASAQTKEAVKAQMSVAVCECLTKNSATAKPDNMSKDQIKQVFIQCFGGAAGKEMKAIQKAYGQSAFADKAVMRTMGEEVGAQLVQECPVSMSYFVAMADESSGPKIASSTTGQTTGKLGGLSGPGVTLLEVQTNAVEKVYFAWVRHFEQADELLQKLPQLQGQRARVSWQEVLVLQPDVRQYQTVREITAIELL